MGIKLQLPKLTDLRPRLTVVGIGGAGCNAVNNMIAAGLTGVDFVVANTDAQSLAASSAEHRLQLGVTITEGLGAGARPEIGQAAAEEAIEDVRTQFSGSHMVFIAAGMGGGTGTGAAAVIARAAREMGILTVGVVTKPFLFEGTRRMKIAEAGIEELRKHVDTLIVIPNQNLFLIATEKTSFAEAFVLADQVLYSGVACVVDLIIKEGLINLDFADVRAVLADMGTAMMGTGEAEGAHRAKLAAEEAITNPLLDDVSLSGATGLLLSITGGPDLTLFEVDEAASRVREEIQGDANIIVGATFDDSLGESVRVSIVASGMRRTGDTSPARRASDADSSLGWPNNPPRVQAPHVESYSYSQVPPKPPPSLSPLMSGDGYAASFDETAEVGTQQGSEAGRSELGKSEPPSADMTSQNGADAMTAGITPGAVSDTDQSSEDMDHATSASETGEPDQAFQTWQAPGNVLIEEGIVPQRADVPETLDSHGASNSEVSGNQNPDFVPAPPVETPRRDVRMPQVEDFPVVGQRAYFATKEGAPPLEPLQTQEETDINVIQNGAQKTGIFARLSAMAGLGSERSNGRPRLRDEQRRPDRLASADGDGFEADPAKPDDVTHSNSLGKVRRQRN